MSPRFYNIGIEVHVALHVVGRLLREQLWVQSPYKTNSFV